MHMTVRHRGDLVGFGRGGCFGGLRESGVFTEDLDFAAIGVHAVSKRSTTSCFWKQVTYVSDPWLWQSVYEDGGFSVAVASETI